MRITVQSKTTKCANYTNCGNSMERAHTTGRPPKYCTICRNSIHRDQVRVAQVKHRRNTAQLDAARVEFTEEWNTELANPGEWAGTRPAGVLTASEAQDESRGEETSPWVDDNPRAGLPEKYNARREREPVNRVPASVKAFADRGAVLDVDEMRAKSCAQVRLPDYSHWVNPAPKERDWKPINEWLGSLPDDGIAWKHGRSIAPDLWI